MCRSYKGLFSIGRLFTTDNNNNNKIPTLTKTEIEK